jgi:hypothetical protein
MLKKDIKHHKIFMIAKSYTFRLSAEYANIYDVMKLNIKYAGNVIILKDSNRYPINRRTIPNQPIAL